MASSSAYSRPAGVGPVVSPMTSPSSRRAAAPSNLDPIEEDGGFRPDNSQRPQHGSMARIFSTFQAGQTREPPLDTEYNDVRGPRGEKFSDLRNNRHVAKRGGWTRVLLIAFIVLLIVVGLAVGLGVGLTRPERSSSPASPSPSPSAPAAAFPAGSYAFDTYLSTISTACTPNSDTWRCYPYSTYRETGSGADTTFNWIIAPTEENGSDYVISSTNNPFALDFINATLSMTNTGQSSEAYRFSINMQKTVIPNVTLTPDGASTDCFYNGTIFSAVLYTRKEKTYPAQNITSPSATGSFLPWPYAVEVQQVANGGTRVPDCYKMINGNNGQHVPIGNEPDTQTCQCIYQNYGA